MITLVGVGHVFRLRESVGAIIGDLVPDLVCVELDDVRYKALRERQKGQAPSFLYGMISDFQERLAETYGSSVGDEMLAAVEAAGQVGAYVAMIDMDSRLVFKRMFSELTLKERVMFVLTAIGGIFITKKRVEKELKRFEEHQDEYMQELEHRFPTLKRVLIDERNAYMASRLQMASDRFANIVAVVGDGHIRGMSSLLDEANVEHRSIRLSDIRSEDFIERWRMRGLEPDPLP